MKEDTQRAYEHGLCSQRLSGYLHFQNYYLNQQIATATLEVALKNVVTIFSRHTIWQLKLLIECKFFR